MRLPEIGELNRRIKLLSVSGVPVGDSDLSTDRTLIQEVWAKVEINGGVAYWESVNTEETVTHRFYVRYVVGYTRPQDLRHITEVDCEGVRYRVRRCTDVNGAHRFTMLECEEIGIVDP